MDTTRKKDPNILFNFAFCGVNDDFQRTLYALSCTAENEPWTVDASEPNGVLSYYIKNTFTRCYDQNKILYTADKKNCCFNTGLLTPNGNDIMFVFRENNKQGKDIQKWAFFFFADRTERRYMDLFATVPELATYTDNYEDFYFHPEYDIILNNDHILDDNWDRISSVVPLDKAIVKAMLKGLIEETCKKIKRNLRLVIPQYYKNQIMYLIPINFPIKNETYVTMALAVEPTNSKQYRANTIFTKEMAYEKARLLSKPESNWLLIT